MSIFKNFLIVLWLSVLWLTITPRVLTNAASLVIEQPKQGQQNITQNQNNLYVLGSDVVVSGEVEDGLTSLTGDLLIKGNIQGDVTAISSKLKIESQSVNGSIRAAAGEVVVSGRIEHDIVLFAVEVVFYKAEILGDVIVYSNKISFQETYIQGNITGKYSEIIGNLEMSVRGNLNLEKIDDIFTQFDTSRKINWSLSLLALVILLTFTKKLKNNETKIGPNIYLDGMLGLLSVLAIIILQILTWVLGLYWILGFLLSLAMAVFLFSNVYLSIYIANLLVNQFKISVPIYSYIIIFHILFISNISLLVVSQLIFLLYWFGVLGVIGFVMKTAFNIFVQKC